MADIVIIADDLTGACDTGVKMAHLGYDAQVLTSPQGISEMRRDKHTCYTLNTDTRSVPPDDAYKKLKAAALALKEAGRTRCYKKIDSVLRGNIGREIDALMETLGHEFSIIAPTLPENGRTLTGGVLHIDNFNGNTYDIFAADAVGATTDRSCGVIGIDAVHAGAQAVLAEIDHLLADDITLLIVDAETDEDLGTVAQAVIHYGDRVLPVGSAGLIRHLVERNGEQTPDVELRQRDTRHPVISVVGSRHPSTVLQVQRLKDRADTAFVVFDGNELAHTSPDDIADACLQGFAQQMDSGKRYDNIVVTTQKIYDGKTYSGNKVLCADITNEAIAETVTKTAARIIGRYGIGAVIASGGDIAGKLIERLGASRLRLLAEPMPGVAAGTLFCKDGNTILIATKSGGFGDADALARLADYMATTQVATLATQPDTTIIV